PRPEAGEWPAHDVRAYVPPGPRWEGSGEEPGGMGSATRFDDDRAAVRWAQQHMPTDGMNGILPWRLLTAAEHRAVDDYTGTGYPLVDGGLLHGNVGPGWEREFFQLVDQLDPAVDRSRLPESLILHAGADREFLSQLLAAVDPGSRGVPDPENVQALVGTTFTNHTYVRASIGSHFPGEHDVYLVVRAPEGHPGLNVMRISGFGEDERGILLPRNGRNVIHAVYQRRIDAPGSGRTRDAWFVEVETVPADWEPTADWRPSPLGDADRGYPRPTGEPVPSPWPASTPPRPVPTVPPADAPAPQAAPVTDAPGPEPRPSTPPGTGDDAVSDTSSVTDDSSETTVAGQHAVPEEAPLPPAADSGARDGSSAAASHLDGADSEDSDSDASASLFDADQENDTDATSLLSESDDSDAESFDSTPLLDRGLDSDDDSDDDSGPAASGPFMAGQALPTTLAVYSAIADSAPDGSSNGTAASVNGTRPDAEGRDSAPSASRQGDASTGSEGSGRGRGGRTVDEARTEAARAQTDVVRFETDLENTRATFGLAEDDPYYLGGRAEAAERRVTAAEAEIALAQARLADARGSRTGTETARAEMARAQVELGNAQRDLAQARERLAQAGGTIDQAASAQRTSAAAPAAHTPREADGTPAAQDRGDRAPGTSVNPAFVDPPQPPAGALDTALAELATPNTGPSPAPGGPTAASPGRRDAVSSGTETADVSDSYADFDEDMSDVGDRATHDVGSGSRTAPRMSHRSAPVSEDSDSADSSAETDDSGSYADSDSEAGEALDITRVNLEPLVSGLGDMRPGQALTMLADYYRHHVDGESLDVLYPGALVFENDFQATIQVWRENGVLEQGLRELENVGFPPPADGWASIVDPARRTVPLDSRTAERFGSVPGQHRDFSVTTDDGAVLPARITQRPYMPGHPAHPRFEWNRIPRSTPDGRDLTEAVVRLERGQPPAGTDPAAVADAERQLVTALESQVNDGRPVPDGQGGIRERVPYTLRDGSELRLRVQLVDPGEAPDALALHGRLDWEAPSAEDTGARPDHTAVGPEILAWFGLTESSASQAAGAEASARRAEASVLNSQRYARSEEAVARRGTNPPSHDIGWTKSETLRGEAWSLRREANALRRDAVELRTQGDVDGALAKQAEARTKLAEAQTRMAEAQAEHPVPPGPDRAGTSSTVPTAADADPDAGARRAEAAAMETEAAALRAALRALDAEIRATRVNDPAEQAAVRADLPPRVTATALARISELTAESTSVPARVHPGLAPIADWTDPRGQAPEETRRAWEEARRQAPVTVIGSRLDVSGQVHAAHEMRTTSAPPRPAHATDPAGIQVPGNPPGVPERVLPARRVAYSTGDTGLEVRRIPIPAKHRTPGGPTHVAEVTLRVKFDRNGVDPAVIDRNMAAYHAELNRKLNHQFRVPNTDGTPGDQFHVTVVDVDRPGMTGPADHHVTWGPTVDGKTPRSHQSMWAVDDEPADWLHETMHMFGIGDDYPDGDAPQPSALRRRIDQSGVDRLGANIMATRKRLGFVSLRQHQLDRIGDLIRPALDRGNGGPTPYEPPVRIADLPRDVRDRIGAPLHQDAPLDQDGSPLVDSPEQAIEFLAAYHDHHERGRSIADVSDNLSRIRTTANGENRTLTPEEVQNRLHETWQHWRASGALDTALAELADTTTRPATAPPRQDAPATADRPAPVPGGTDGEGATEESSGNGTDPRGRQISADIQVNVVNLDAPAAVPVSNGQSGAAPGSGNGTRPAAEGRVGTLSTPRGGGDTSAGPEGSGRGRGGRTVDDAREEVARAQIDVARFETDLENTRTNFGLSDDDPYYLGGLIEAAERRVAAAQAETDLAHARLDDARGSRTGTELARSEMDRARTELDHAQRDLAQARDRFTRAGGTFND
ncbi:hypothetical protein DEF24_24235, partial [Marinitenerispora sediminis]